MISSGSDDDIDTSTPDSGGNLIGVNDTCTEISLDSKCDVGSLKLPTNNSDTLDDEDVKHVLDNIDNESSDESEPLGYKHFLYDINIEYNLGGTRSSLGSHENSFRLKNLPYMIENNNCRPVAATNDATTSSGSKNTSMGSSGCTTAANETLESNDCDVTNVKTNGSNNTGHNNDNHHQYQIDLSYLQAHESLIDVTKATCAFLGNSDYVPIEEFERKRRRPRVVMELISAKLSQNASSSAPTTSLSSNNLKNLVDLAESSAINNSFNSDIHCRNGDNDNNHRALATSSPVGPLTSSRKFVNYTILVRQTPGIDHHPAVIERRFSDFLTLYQGFKSKKQYAKILDQVVTFPKKVYTGNFNISKIVERSFEFTNLLNLCLYKHSFLWSVPFASFLIDKELKEAHWLSLFGDPDDVEALVETVYNILRKLYLRFSNEIDTNQKVSRSPSSVSSSTSSASTNTSISSTATTSQRNSLITSIGPINQRFLVTYCMLFIVHCRNQNYDELNRLIDEFGQLISAPDFVDSLIPTRHYSSLRACLLFLMNLNQCPVIDADKRQWLIQQLEEIDGIYAELTNQPEHRLTSESLSASSSSSMTPDRNHQNRITKKDLTSLLRERNFCTFQDNTK